MPARPWYPFNPGDYRRKTAHLTLEQDAAYRRLIDFAWDNDGVIPKQPKQLARIWGVHTNKAQNLWGILKIFWYETEGGFRCKRVDKELAQAIESHNKRVSAGRKGGLSNARSIAQAPTTTITTTDPEKENNTSYYKRKAVDNFAGSKRLTWAKLKAMPPAKVVNLAKEMGVSSRGKTEAELFTALIAKSEERGDGPRPANQAIPRASGE